jgi:hypothetical protein
MMSKQEAIERLKEKLRTTDDPFEKKGLRAALRALGEKVDDDDEEQKPSKKEDPVDEEARALARAFGAAALPSRDLGCEIDFGSGDRAQAARYISALDKIRGAR